MSDTPRTDAEEVKLGDDAYSQEWISFARELERENNRFRAALAEIGDKNNWGYFDESGCAKGAGSYRDSFVGDEHPLDLIPKLLEGLPDFRVVTGITGETYKVPRKE